MKEEKLSILTDKYLFNTISTDELQELNLLLQDPELKLLAEKRLLSELADNAYQIDADLSPLQQKIVDQTAVMNRLHHIPVSNRHYAGKSWFKYAAIAIVTFGIGTAIHLYLKKDGGSKNIAGTTLISDSSSALTVDRKKAILLLEDGSSIDLNATKAGALDSHAGNSVKKDEAGRLVYGMPGASSPATDDKISYHSVLIPRGVQYQLVLSDGTQVWLNAQSSLRFPTVFKGRERKVELSGEAYFEVAKNSTMPFYITANGTDVEVLGTSFNVHAYDHKVTTTLITGSVKLKHDDANVILKPGQSGTAKDAKPFKVQVADIEAAMAWKNGYFIFHDENIKTIMDKVARWYDIDVVYNGDVTGVNLYGKISRSESIEDLLKNLKQTRIVHIEMHGKTVTITP